MTFVKVKNRNCRPTHKPEFGDLFDDIFGRTLPNLFSGDGFVANSPKVNVQKNEKGHTLEIAAPGLNKEDFKIKLDDNLLTISAKVEKSEETTENNYSRKEFEYSTFSRSFTLPETTDLTGIEANYENGILFVLLPEKETPPTEPAIEIEVK